MKLLLFSTSLSFYHRVSDVDVYRFASYEYQLIYPGN